MLLTDTAHESQTNNLKKIAGLCCQSPIGAASYGYRLQEPNGKSACRIKYSIGSNSWSLHFKSTGLLNSLAASSIRNRVYKQIPYQPLNRFLAEISSALVMQRSNISLIHQSVGMSSLLRSTTWQLVPAQRYLSSGACERLLTLGQQMDKPVLRSFHVLLQVGSFCSDTIPLDIALLLCIADGFLDVAGL
jgi:hypothetical protein